MIVGYEQAFTDAEEGTTEEIIKPEIVKAAMRSALRRKWRHLARERIKNTKPTIPLGERFWPWQRKNEKKSRLCFSEEKVRCLITSLRSRDDDASIEVLDAAYLMVDYVMQFLFP